MSWLILYQHFQEQADNMFLQLCREEDMEGFMKVQNVETLKIVVWHVLEYDHFQVEDHSYGQFHEGDTYVIRWQYMICNAGMLKSLDT